MFCKVVQSSAFIFVRSCELLRRAEGQKPVPQSARFEGGVTAGYEQNGMKKAASLEGCRNKIYWNAQNFDSENVQDPNLFRNPKKVLMYPKLRAIL